MSGEPAGIEALDSALARAGDPDRAKGSAQYLKSDLTHYGVRVPEIKRIALEHWRSQPHRTHADLVAWVEALWAVPAFERRLAAVKILCAERRRLQLDDLERVERMMRASKTWALLDELAIHGAGPVLERGGGLGSEPGSGSDLDGTDPRSQPDPDAIVARWAADSDFWIRRAALLCHILPLRSADDARAGPAFDRFGRLAAPMLAEREFFAMLADWAVSACGASTAKRLNVVWPVSASSAVGL